MSPSLTSQIHYSSNNRHCFFLRGAGDSLYLWYLHSIHTPNCKRIEHDWGSCEVRSSLCLNWAWNNSDNLPPPPPRSFAVSIYIFAAAFGSLIGSSYATFCTHCHLPSLQVAYDVTPFRWSTTSISILTAHHDYRINWSCQSTKHTATLDLQVSSSHGRLTWNLRRLWRHW